MCEALIRLIISRTVGNESSQVKSSPVYRGGNKKAWCARVSRSRRNENPNP